MVWKGKRPYQILLVYFIQVHLLAINSLVESFVKIILKLKILLSFRNRDFSSRVQGSFLFPRYFPRKLLIFPYYLYSAIYLLQSAQTLVSILCQT